MASRYERTVWVAVGWHVVTAGALFANSRLPREASSCDDAVSWCFTAQEAAQLLLVVGLFWLGASLLAALLVAVALSRRVTPVFAAGTLAALGGVVAASLGTLLWIATG